ncbi:MAG: C25 family cysteine peptidase [candidate division WOR-3 bacterium]
MKIVLFFLFSLAFSDSLYQYLIITNEKFVPALELLKEWKTKKGMRAKIIAVPSGYPRDSIKEIVRRIRPEYLLLVGDKNYLPPGDSFYPFSQLLLGDNFYGDLEGDYRAEIPVGRFPCSTPGECSTMVRKVLIYERFPPRDDTLWYKRGALVFMWDYGGRPNNPIYSAEFPYDDSLMRLRYSQIDTIFNDTLFGHSGYDDAEDIISALNRGIGILLYRGHAEGNWVYPFTVEPEDEKLANGSKLPIIISGSCYTIFKGENPVGERWLKVKGKDDSLKGAVAFFGTQLGGLFGRWRGRFVRTFLKAIFAEDSLILGKAFLRAKDSLASKPVSDSNEIFYREWSLLGDPALSIWTKVPKTLLVSYQDLPNNEFLVRVRDGRTGRPLPGALVCLTAQRDSSFYHTGYTNSGGVIKFSLNANSSLGILVTVTFPNYLPYESPFYSICGNLFQDETTVTYLLPKKGFVLLRVYDINGRLVKKLEEGVKEAGFYELRLRRENLAKGIYFVSLSTPYFSEVKKVIIP